MRPIVVGMGVGAALLVGACGGSESSSPELSLDPATRESTDAPAQAGDQPAPSQDELGEPRPDRPVDLPYFYGFGCEGAGVTLLDLADFYGKFDPTSASLDDAATFRAMGVALTTAADLPDEGALADGVTLADQSIYATGIAAQDLADVIEGGGFTREVEEQTSILGEDATRTVQECGLE